MERKIQPQGDDISQGKFWQKEIINRKQNTLEGYV
jgi:hypothetical protein